MNSREIIVQNVDEITYRDMWISRTSLGISGREDGVDKNNDDLNTKAITFGVAMAGKVGTDGTAARKCSFPH